MELLPTHRHESLISDCVDILNNEWPRSKGARLHSLSKSCDNLPVALAFVQSSKNENDQQKTVIGFSKISDVQGRQNSCLLESVVIRDEDRGKGFGRILMEMTEQYAKRLGIKTVYLNTTDKVGFYSHLGYVECKPVVSLGANAHRVPDSMLKHFLQDTDKETSDAISRTNQQQSSFNCNNNRQEPQLSNNILSLATSCTSDPSSLPSQPPPPPPPPLAPPPLPKTGTTNTPAIVRLDPSQVTWMKKEL